MRYFLILTLIAAWSVAWPLFAWWSWSFPDSFAAFGWADWAVAAVDLLIFTWVLTDLTRMLRRA